MANWMTHDMARARAETNRINDRLTAARHYQETGQWYDHAPQKFGGAASAPRLPPLDKQCPHCTLKLDSEDNLALHVAACHS